MLVLCFVRLSLHEANKWCDVRPAHEQPGQNTQQASVSFVHLWITIAIWVSVVHMSAVNV
eukprot:10969185-Prorocentrum_lima.AAC.1